MEVAMPMTGSAIDCYEDMFKEITRKLYGEDGLPDLSTTERIPSTGTDRGLTPIDYEVDNPILKPEEHLTAFGLAALMQNGFPGTGILNTTFPTHKTTINLNLNASLQAEDKWICSEESLQWTQSKVATYNALQKLFRCSDCESVGYLHRVAEHWLGTHSNLRAFHCPQCSYESAWARCVRIHLGRQHNINIDESCDALTKDNPVLQDIVKFLQRLKNKIDNGGGKPTSTNSTSQTVSAEEFQNMTSSSSIQGTLGQSSSVSNNAESSVTSNKRYSCTYCPYATDRRDLFTRHENIHREEKPFQCYVCQKQFNRADHVKKHFLRMHRDHPYDLNRIRRHPPKNASGMSYYQKYNSNSTTVQAEAMNSLSTISSLSIPGFNGISRSPSVSSIRQTTDVKSLSKPSLTSKSGKKKGEKRFSCCYCSWSGVDNWCLKRHMNTHLKPFVCGLCDYKAARSERLATHVLKVHNKRACAKCNFLAEDLTQLTAHQQEQHPLESRNRALTGMPASTSTSSVSSSNILRTNAFNSGITAPSATVTSSTSTNNTSNNTISSQTQSILKNSDLTAAAAQILQHNRFLQNEVKSWKSQIPKQHGAARLFSYMEASDGSEPETESHSRTSTAEDMSSRAPHLTHRIQSDFLEAGGVDASQPEAEEEAGEEETELPLFVCQTCGCEFEDDLSLETHQFTHRHVTTSPAKSEDTKENVDPYRKYSCKLCDASFENQNGIISHMAVHTNLTVKPVVLPTPLSISGKRSRKQSKPKKVIIPYWDSDEVEVLRHLNGKLRKWKGYLTSETPLGTSKLVDKYMAQLVTRRGLTCKICRNSGVSRYHTKASLALHHFWKHSRKRFCCEHCNMTFKHRYQIILHSSRVHTEHNTLKHVNTPSNLTVMMPAIKETTHISLENVSATDLNSFTNFFNSSHSVAVPDANMSNAHKLGMSFFDHSFIQNNVVSNHMPIIIPTFQPN